MGQLPLLEIDGISLHQSRTICRYLGKKCNIIGNDDKEAANIDIVADVIYDFIMSKQRDCINKKKYNKEMNLFQK